MSISRCPLATAALSEILRKPIKLIQAPFGVLFLAVE
jgi:hypothetical protein